MQHIENKLRVCKTCGWVAFGVTRKFALSEVKKFGEYFNSLSKQKRKDYYNNQTATLEEYECCHRCNGSYKNFERVTSVHKIPIGSTISPIIKG